MMQSGGWMFPRLMYVANTNPHLQQQLALYVSMLRFAARNAAMWAGGAGQGTGGDMLGCAVGRRGGCALGWRRGWREGRRRGPQYTLQRDPRPRIQLPLVRARRDVF